MILSQCLDAWKKWGTPFGLLALALLTVSAHSTGPDTAAEEGKRVRVVAERFSFTPSRITVAAGTSLEIELVSEDTFHGFRLPDANLNVTIPPQGKGSVVIRFQAQPGEYPFECSRPCGAGHTLMRGVIVVQ